MDKKVNRESACLPIGEGGFLMFPSVVCAKD